MICEVPTEFFLICTLVCTYETCLEVQGHPSKIAPNRQQKHSVHKPSPFYSIVGVVMNLYM